MSSDNLLTKYRPTSFDEIYGHAAVVRSIKHLCRLQNPSAFLLTGASGVGKTTVARLIAKEFGIAAEAVIEVDGASYNGVDSMRSLMEQLNYKPLISQNNKQAVILDEVHAITKNAAQALLKTLEEPPEGVVWILCTTDPDRLLKTIRTRCYEYGLEPVDSNTLFDMLADIADAEGFGVSDEVLDLIVDRSEGLPRAAIANLGVCSELTDPQEAGKLIVDSGEGEATRLARSIVRNELGSWSDVMVEVRQSLVDNGNSAESVRLAIVAYIGRCLLNERKDDAVPALLDKLEAFTEPYEASEGIAPLVRSVGILFFGSTNE